MRWGNWAVLQMRSLLQISRANAFNEDVDEVSAAFEALSSSYAALLSGLIPLQAPVSNPHRSLECRCARETHISLKRALPPSCLPISASTQPCCNHMDPILTLIIRHEVNLFQRTTRKTQKCLRVQGGMFIIRSGDGKRLVMLTHYNHV